MDPAPWRRAFGISADEIPRPWSETDCHRAYRSIDPEDTPEGPTALNVARPRSPFWSIGGGYGSDDWILFAVRKPVRGSPFTSPR